MTVEGCEWGALACSSGAGTSAAFLFDLLGTESYAAFADGQLDYVLGDNEYGMSFVVGYGDNSPEHPHHRNSAVLGEPLVGALVGGPSADDADGFGAGYNDDMDDYVHNEVAIDYNTGLVGLAAFRVAQERRK
jgi:endoglucanase